MHAKQVFGEEQPVKQTLDDCNFEVRADRRVYWRRPNTIWHVDWKLADPLRPPYDVVFDSAFRDGRVCELFALVDPTSYLSILEIQIWPNSEIECWSDARSLVRVHPQKKRITIELV